MSYSDKPRPCHCFNGYCYRSLCAEKVVDKAIKAEARKQERPAKTSKRHPPILSWHKDLSEETDSGNK